MNLDEALKILKENDLKVNNTDTDPNEYYGCDVKKTIDTDGEILLMKDMPGDICPNCDGGSDYTTVVDTDQQDDFVFTYYGCSNCGCRWREDSKKVPKFITNVKWPDKID